MAIQYVLWDWNGTLLDDVQIAVDTNNDVFPLFDLPLQVTLEDYLELFDFPVKDYYLKVGVPEPLFDAVAQQWSLLYMENSKKALLQKDAESTLDFFSDKGCTQVIISASKQEHLHQQVARYSIEKYFDAMLGLNNIYAVSKVDLAKQYLKKQKISPKQALFIGDTLHDAQVAQAIGCTCVLVAKGHHPRYRLSLAGVPVFDSLLEVQNQFSTL
ncbi:MAG: HAD family hydrolase [Clostridiales bacterium]|nr:HAD family hydrolase [Clostridiales bacterium]